jgi:hypothetical protein
MMSRSGAAEEGWPEGAASGKEMVMNERRKQMQPLQKILTV